jgi:glycosyltransferase involved in cell wall biosynthesis
MSPRRPRAALLPSESLRPHMAGIAIRYAEMARTLPRLGVDVVLVQPGEQAAAAELGLPLADLRGFERGKLASILADCDVAISQGQLANDLLVEAPQVPSVIDLYDPFLIENMHYLPSLGLDPYRNDHATFVLQMSRGDFFLCSCDEQRQFYLGFLAALGRVNPHILAADPDLAGLIATVPFGVPAEPPAARPLLSSRRPGERRLLFGGLYDWYDPWPLLEAVAGHRERDWKLLFIRNPNPGTPQRLFAEVEAWCRQRGLWGGAVEATDWVPSERRYDLLREVDLLVATHKLDLETRLSLRTRFLDAFCVGCPVLTSEGGAVARLLRENGAGWVVPEGDPAALAAAISEILAGGPELSLRVAAARRLAAEFSWDKVLAPLAAFCQAARRDPYKEDFAHRPATVAPADAPSFRLRRFLRRRFGIGGAR